MTSTSVRERVLCGVAKGIIDGACQVTGACCRGPHRSAKGIPAAGHVLQNCVAKVGRRGHSAMAWARGSFRKLTSHRPPFRALGWATSAITARQSWQQCRAGAQQRCVGAATFCACLASLNACGIHPVVGIVAGYAVAWRLARAQVHSHGASCRRATAVAAGASTSFLVGFPYGVLLAAAIGIICPSAWLWWPPSKNEENFSKLMTELQTFIVDHGGELPKETMGHPGRQLAMKIRNFCRHRDTTKEQLAELEVVKQNASQALEASAERMTSEENRPPKRRRQLQASDQSGASSADACREAMARIGQASTNQDAAVMAPSLQTRPQHALGHGVGGSAAADEPYYERQQEAWCGMHVINNYLQGPFANKDSCRDAVRRVCNELSQPVGDSRRGDNRRSSSEVNFWGQHEDAADHRDPAATACIATSRCGGRKSS